MTTNHSDALDRLVVGLHNATGATGPRLEAMVHAASFVLAKMVKDEAAANHFAARFSSVKNAWTPTA